jgi:LCP family protein required for cell wall assembly
MHAKPRPRPYRRWPRRVLLAVNVVVAVGLIGSGIAYGWVRYQFANVKTGSSSGLTATEGTKDTKQAASGLKAENILLIGNQTRAGQTKVNFGNPALLTGTLSDIAMVLHLDPRAGTASIISIPRDVFAPMPAGSPVGPFQKIDAALNDGKLGPNNLARAITEDFGIPINHYVEVDFDGFLNTVNALGGIRMDFPERLFDAYSNLDISHTGCQLIHGYQALALVRSRHLQYDPPGVSPYDHAAWPYDPESDLARIVRDHTFLRVLVKTGESEGLSNPLKLNAFLSSVLHQLTIDPGLKQQLVSLALHYRHINPNAVAETTIPVTQVTGNGSGYYYRGVGMGDVEFPDANTIEKWDPGALPSPVQPHAVRVYNDTSTYHLAADTGSALTSDGFHVTAESNGTDPASVSETLVQYHPGQLAMGFDVFQKLRGAVILQSLKSVPSGTVDVQAGSIFAVDKPLPAGSSKPGTRHSPPASAPTPGGQQASSAKDDLTPYDPRPCSA